MTNIIQAVLALVCYGLASFNVYLWNKTGNPINLASATFCFGVGILISSLLN